MMSLVSKFKRSTTPEPTLTPGRAALRDNLLAIRDLQAKRQEVFQRDASARRDIDAEAAALADVEAKRTAIDVVNADARYAQIAPPDLSQQERELLDAVANHTGAAQRAREAAHLQPKYAEALRLLTERMNALVAQTNRLLHTAINEDLLGDLAEEFREKEEAFREVHRRAFVRAWAADKIALSQRYGAFANSATYFDLTISRPTHAAFARPVEQMLPEAAMGVVNTDGRKLDADADALIHELLNSERG